VTCTLIKHHLPETTSHASPKAPDLDCSTLSYVWGDPRWNIRKIKVNGVNFHVTGNLHAALMQVRQRDKNVSLWIDAICIDQRNDDEKGKQVMRMGEIYRRSKGTIIWLGNGDWSTGAAIETLFNMARNLAYRPQSNSTILPPVLEGLW
ncbi:hypothetical protein EK21DRAFT_12311, partial [Setomelanomma holmii]